MFHSQRWAGWRVTREPEARRCDCCVKHLLPGSSHANWFLMLQTITQKSCLVVRKRPLPACQYTRGSWWTNQGKPPFGLCWTRTCEPKRTQTFMSRSHINKTLTNSLSPEGRVDANVVWLWEGRCSPPAAGGGRREILLILRLHISCISSVFHCRRPHLIMVFLLHVFPSVSLPAAVSNSCLSQGCGMRPVGLLLWVLGNMASWRVIITFVRVTFHTQSWNFPWNISSFCLWRKKKNQMLVKYSF